MLQDIPWVNRFNTYILKSMTDDVSPDLWRGQPPGIINHAAWQVGHLTNARANLAGILGAPCANLPTDLKTRFGTGSIPEPHSLGGQDKLMMLESFWLVQNHIADLLSKATPELMSLPTPNETYRERFPTVRDMTLLILTVHDSLHLGQLSAWRNAMGLPRVLG